MVEFAKFLLKIIFGILFKVELIGRENIPQKGSAILCANHIGELDMFFIGYRIKRVVHWMAKEELFKVPVIGYFLGKVGAYPVRRGRADIESIKTSLRLLNEGHIIGIFPEGTRTRRKEGKDISIKRGAVSIALKADVPIIPVAVTGSYKPFTRVRVIYGKPFKLDADIDRKYSSEEMTEFAKGIMKRIYNLLEEK